MMRRVGDRRDRLTDAARIRCACGLLAVGLGWPAAMCPAEAVIRDRQAPSASQPSSSVSDAGFWPTSRMVELVLMKGVEALTRQYELDEPQRAALKKDFLTRYPAALRRHRAALQPLINEIIEMQLAEETPTAKRVAEMARRFEPVLKDARNVLRGTHDTIKPLLRFDQRARLDRDFLKIWAGFAAVETRVTQWKRGQFNPGDWPFRPSAARRRGQTAEASASKPTERPGSARGLELLNPLRATRRRPGPGSGGRGADAAGPRELPLDQWQAYVKRFIRRQHLDEGQANQATAILKDVRQRAKDYKMHNRDLFQRIERELADAHPVRRDKLNRDLADLHRPLADLFDELRDRLGDVLSSKQR